MRKQFAVLGLGSFGRSVALTLESMGCDVIVVDKSQETIQEISDRVTYAITADITEKEALSALGTRNLDGAIIGVAENLEAGIMATLLCKEIGIPMVVAKAKNKLQGGIVAIVISVLAALVTTDTGLGIGICAHANMACHVMTSWSRFAAGVAIITGIILIVFSIKDKK